MSKNFNIAIVGATGAVGETMIQILEQRDFPVGEFYPLASERSAGKTVRFKNKQHEVKNLTEFDFSKADIALFSAGSDVSEEFAPMATKANCIVIDNTSHFRRDADIPLIVPEVNAHRLGDYQKRKIIANPNCSTIQMVVALKPIYDLAGITRINVATYQAVSGAGKQGISELVHQSGELLNGRPIEASTLPQQIAFNVMPHIDSFQDNGYTREEMKMVWETQKIFEDDSIGVNPTAVRVPVLYGHSEAIHLETREPISIDVIKAALAAAPGIELLNDESYPTPVQHGSGSDLVYVGRLRKDISHPNGIDLWVVADNVRKGAALNAVQIAELLIREHLT